MGERGSRHKSGPDDRALRVQCLVLICFRVFKDRHSIPVFVMSRHSMSYGVTLQSCHAFLAFILNRVYRKARIRSVTACRHRVLETA